MATYIICCDLADSGQDYSKLAEHLKSYDAYCRLQKSVWLIASGKNPEEIRDRLENILNDDEKLFISEVSAPAAWTDNHSDKIGEWLRTYL